jgi:uncharacterized protein YqcC (DUF446 family)
MQVDEDVVVKVQEVFHELKRLGLWNSEKPAWVRQFAPVTINVEKEFFEWLQFVYLPNCIQRDNMGKNDIAMQAVRFLGKDPAKEKLLQLLIELDALG